MNRSLPLLTILALASCSSRPPPPTSPIPDEQPQAAPGAGSEPETSPPQAAPPPAPPPTDPAPAQAEPDLRSAELAAYENARPVFDKFCASCHAQGGPGARKGTLAHLDITSYPFGGHHAVAVAASIRKSLGVDGSTATMPRNKPGSVTGADLELIKAWADAFDASHATTNPGRHAH